MPILSAGRLIGGLNGNTVAYSVLSLFAAGEVGAWYDPSDFTTMFQDSAGTTPVTAVEQPVGLLLDKSKGLAVGAELVTNGDFSSGSTGWTVGTNWAIAGGVATATAVAYNVDNLDQTFTVTAGKTYKLTFTISSFSAGSLRLDIVGTQSIITGGVAANGSYTYYFVPASGGAKTFRFTGSTFSGSVDNISVKLLDGNHASQSTAASRPVLSARVNLLTQTEDVSTAAWTKFGVASFTANSVTLNAGSNNYIYYSYGAAGPDAGQYTQSAVLSGSGTIAIGFYDGTAWRGTTVALTATPTRYSFTGSATGKIQQVSFGVISGLGGTSGMTFGITAADLRATNDGVNLPAYQRVTTSTDYDTTGFPLYLKFDGTDDSLATTSIDFSATDKMSVFAGVRKLSDAAEGFVCELSTTLNTGTFRLYAPRSGLTNYSWRPGGTLFSEAAATYVAPITSVVSGIGDIAADISTLRVNGVQAATSASDQGTGNFTNNPLYIGARAGTSLFLNGRLYSLIVRGAASTESTIDQTEVWVGNKTGLDLSYAVQQTIFDRFNAPVLDRAGATILQRY